MHGHLWNTRECAQHLPYDEREFRRLMLNGEIPRLSVGPNSTRFRPEAVKAWKECRKRGEELDLTRVPVALANDRLLTTPQCAAYLRVSKKTILRLVRAGEIPYLELGSMVRFIPESIAEWIRSRETFTTEEQRIRRRELLDEIFREIRAERQL